MENILFFPVIISTKKEANEKYYNVFVPLFEINIEGTEGETVGDCIRMARDAILQKCMEYIIKNKELPVFNIMDIDSIEHSKNEIVTLSPQTGDNSNFALWIALLFISGGAVTVTTVYGRKKKHSVK